MKPFNQLIRFFGGIYFAIFLIATTALFVAAGTFLESLTDSHRYASMFTYNSKIFSLLLCGFFLNILISALRRWPFKRKHIPFLITHLGLLMIIGGTLIKGSHGVQGSMTLIEGSGSDEIFIADSHALLIETPKTNCKDKNISLYEFKKNFPSHSVVKQAELCDDLNVTLLNYTPHSKEKLETWIKGNKGILSGISTFPLQPFPTKDSLLPVPKEIDLIDGKWDLIAIECTDIDKTAEKIFIENTVISIRDRIKQSLLFEGSLSTFLSKTIESPYGRLSGKLQLNWSPISGIQDPYLLLTVQQPSDSEEIHFFLSGENALRTQSSRQLTGKAPLDIDLTRKPLLLFLQEPAGDLYLFGFSSDGQFYSESFRQDNLNSLIVYDEGFGGYAVQSKIPFLTYAHGREDREGALKHLLAVELRQNAERDLLPAPLKLLYQTCQACEIDFAKTAIDYLSAWNNNGSWLIENQTVLSNEVKNVLSKIDFQKLPPEIYKGCLWNSHLFEKIDPLLKIGCRHGDALDKLKWPIGLQEFQNSSMSPLELATLQIFAASKQLNEPTFNLSEPSPARLLSSYFRAYGIHPDKILAADDSVPTSYALKLWIASYHFNQTVKQVVGNINHIEHLTENDQAFEPIAHAYSKLLEQLGQTIPALPFTAKELRLATKYFALLEGHKIPSCLDCNRQANRLECPLSTVQTPLTALKKMENNIPCVLIRVQIKGIEQIIALGFDRFGNRIKWPILGGRYLVRFQPLYRKIPYRLRLRQARQINYAGTQQPYSYECDLLIKEKANDHITEKTISMNEVHETWDGYRFYLSSIYPPNPGDIKRVQIVVNYDPAKYFLTYPGACILTLGIILLFWQSKSNSGSKKRKKSKY